MATARRLAELLATGMSPQAIEKKLAALARYVPGVERPIAQLSVIVEGKQLLLRQGDGLIAPGGQLWFNFAPRTEGTAADKAAPDEADSRTDDANATRQSSSSTPDRDDTDEAVSLPLVRDQIATPQELLNQAAALEEEGQLVAATEMYRAALVNGGPVSEVCFALAELLYRQGDLSAARERYYMAIELDEEYVEARANLGCVLAESGERELAVAAVRGPLAFTTNIPTCIITWLARWTISTADPRPTRIGRHSWICRRKALGPIRRGAG